MFLALHLFYIIVQFLFSLLFANLLHYRLIAFAVSIRQGRRRCKDTDTPARYSRSGNSADKWACRKWQVEVVPIALVFYQWIVIVRRFSLLFFSEDLGGGFVISFCDEI